MWHGNVFRALETIDDLAMYLDSEEYTEKETKILKKLEEFDVYIRNNVGFIPNFGMCSKNGIQILVKRSEIKEKQHSSPVFFRSRFVLVMSLKSYQEGHPLSIFPPDT